MRSDELRLSSNLPKLSLHLLKLSHIYSDSRRNCSMHFISGNNLLAWLLPRIGRPTQIFSKAEGLPMAFTYKDGIAILQLIV